MWAESGPGKAPLSERARSSLPRDLDRDFWIIPKPTNYAMRIDECSPEVTTHINITGQTQWALLAFGRAVLHFCWCSVFPRSARKNRTQMVVKYHAAAGRICFKRRHRVSCINHKLHN